MMITKVVAKDNYCLELELGSGGRLFMDCTELLGTTRFCQLKNKKLFNCVKVSGDGSYIEFSDKLKIGASEIINIVLTPKNQ